MSYQSDKSLSETGCIPEIDLHCHILPHWDDGPKAVEGSLRMAEKAVALGISKILVTPHVGRAFGNRPEPPSRNIPVAVSLLQEQIDQAGIQLQLVPGAELTLSSIGFVERILAEPWLTFGANQRYVLVESPFTFWPEWADQLLFELSMNGITPVIAHPERLTDVQKDLDVIQRLVDRGALLQITARSLVGNRREAKACSRRLLEAGLVAVVASDAHTSRHLLPCEVESEIHSIVGDVAAQQILVENPRAILVGDVLASPVPSLPQRKSVIASLLKWSWSKV